MLLPQEEAVEIFITSLTSQLSEWFEEGKVQRIVLVIMSKATGEVLERWKWNFNIVTDGEVVEKGVIKEKSYTELLCAMVLAECVYKVDGGPPTLCKFSLLLSYEELYCSNFTI